jgi:ornithine carbamoyltransferase
VSSVVDLRGRHLLTVNDYSREEIVYLIDLAAELKAAKQEGREQQRLAGTEIALIFEQDSTPTRSALEVAAHDQGAHVTFIGPTGSHMGQNETVKDSARVLGRMYDAIAYRGNARRPPRNADAAPTRADSVADELAEWAGVPVFNDELHPTQILADFLTFDEHVSRPLDEVSFCYLGDASFAMADAYLIGGAKLGMDVRVASPRSLRPAEEILDLARRIAGASDAQILVTEDVEQAVEGCDVLLTDVWMSIGDPAAVWRERIELLLPYQVNTRTMALTGNPDVKFMHCLPAFHNADTTVGKELLKQYGLNALEVTDEVFESRASLVFDQAENRMHTIKAVLVATLGS